MAQTGQTNKRIAEAFSCRTQTVENVRESLSLNGFEVALNGEKRETPPRKKLLGGEQEAKLIGMPLGQRVAELTSIMTSFRRKNGSVQGGL